MYGRRSTISQVLSQCSAWNASTGLHQGGRMPVERSSGAHWRRHARACVPLSSSENGSQGTLVDAADSIMCSCWLAASFSARSHSRGTSPSKKAIGEAVVKLSQRPGTGRPSRTQSRDVFGVAQCSFRRGEEVWLPLSDEHTVRPHSTSPFAEDSSGSVTNGCRAGREAGPHACMRPSTICTMPPIHCLQMYRRLAPAHSQQRGQWRKRRAKRVLGCSSLPTVARSR